jgi:ATP-dependent protease ClpP protease subunit
VLKCLLLGGSKIWVRSEAFAIYDTIQYVKPPVHTIAIGTAWGEAAMLLSAGKKVKVEDIYQLFIYAIFTGAQSRTSIC